MAAIVRNSGRVPIPCDCPRRSFSMLLALARIALAISVCRQPSSAGETELQRDIEIVACPGGDGAFGSCTHIAFRGEEEIVTAGNRLYFREGPSATFRPSPFDGLNDAHSVAYNRHDRLYYVADSGNHRVLALASPSQRDIVSSADALAGIALDRPHDVIASSDGWLYVLNPNRAMVFRFKAFGKQESAFDLTKQLGYSRALSVVNEKLYVIGSSAGKVVEISDFESRRFRVYSSFGKRRDAPAGSWKTTGLVPNDAEYYDGYWYVTSYFCPTYAAGENCNEHKVIRFKVWNDFETGRWEDISGMLPANIVPYYLTLRENALYLAAFYHEQKSPPGKVFRITKRRT